MLPNINKYCTKHAIQCCTNSDGLRLLIENGSFSI